MNVRFVDPWFLLLGFVPLAAWLLRRRGACGVPYSALLLFSGVQVATWRTRLRWLPAVLFAMAVALVVVALARPQIARRQATVSGSGRSLLLVLDVSGSMAARDGAEGPTRLERMKGAVHRMLEGGGLEPGDQVGVATVSEFPRVACPLTTDRRAVAAVVDSLEVDHLGDRTNLGDAIGLAIDRLRACDSADRRILVYSDGAHNVAEALSPGEGARIAQSLGIRIGVAAVLDPSRQDGGRDGSDEATLRRICEWTGGEFTRADDSAELLTRAGLGKARNGLAESEWEWADLYPQALANALLLLFLEVVARRAVIRS